MIRRAPGSEIATITSGTEKEKKSYCRLCANVGVGSPLKHRIYLDDKGNITTPGPPDADQWRQCWTCGDIIPAYEAKQEADLVTLAEPRAKPPSSSSWQNIIQAVGDSRKFDRSCKTQKKKQFKQNLEQYKEEDVKDALRKGSKLVSYTER